MVTSMQIAHTDWLFSQSSPMTTKDFIKAAERRGFRLKTDTLRDLWSQGALMPMYAVHEAPIVPPISASAHPRRYPSGTWTVEFTGALTSGRLSDPAHDPLPEDWPFREAERGDPENWWNRLLYSPWQIIDLANMFSAFSMWGHPVSTDDGSLKLSESMIRASIQSRQTATILTAIESRYLPTIRDRWIHLINADTEEWRAFRNGYDPRASAMHLGVDAQSLIHTADSLLFRAHSIDPLGPWARIVRHADRGRQDKLKGPARLSVDLRRAAEVLLQFAEDLGETPPKPSGRFWSPWLDRIERHNEQLDEALVDMGISPHPRVILILEGESEVLLASKILRYLDRKLKPEELQIIPMRGVRNKERIRRLAAHLATPVIIGKYGSTYETLRPLCQIIVATDPEPPMDNPTRFKCLLIDDIVQGLRDQGVSDIPKASLQPLVEVECWEAEFEYAHFDDEEIAKALVEVGGFHQAEDGPEKAAALVGSLRAKRVNLSSATPRLSKIALATALWPMLSAKIHVAINQDEHVPPLVAVVDYAAALAMGARRKRLVLEAEGPA